MSLFLFKHNIFGETVHKSWIFPILNGINPVENEK